MSSAPTNQVSSQIANHLRQVFFGGNWTYVDLRTTLENVNCQQAIAVHPNGHSIVKLTFHISYFVRAIIPVLDGLPLNAHDRYSFDHPELKTDSEWRSFVVSVLKDTEHLAQQIENLPDAVLWENFTDPKYGTYYRNLHGLIEHTHYHLGQIKLMAMVSH